MQVITTWALTCLESSVHQRPCAMKEIETWLIMSGVYCWAIKGSAIAESKDESSHSAV